MIRALALFACLLTVCITASSAFIRHTQNGVGCDGWPACYRAAQVATATAAPTAEAPGAVRIARSLHRVSATLVGVLVLFVTLFGWSSMRAAERVVTALALLDTAFLAWLGRYTPHDLPLVTLGNLIGGLLLVAALAWIVAARRGASARSGATGTTAASGAAGIAVAGFVLLGALAWSGTMTGARHVIDACGTLWCADAHLDWAAMDPVRVMVALDAAAARGIHLGHRLVALLFVALVARLALRLRGARPVLAASLAVLALVQALLGAGTALGVQPLASATLHNVVAALLAALLAVAAALAQPGRGGAPAWACRS
ncbi:MAG: COX15/CtaA family protein [Burkholderiaceae bacterium]|jgi:cytochrome c oxidase assembly protein subunit 15|nr:COX15/CtaA family protein [Burkholderiaceae bacterium]MEB2351988.1 COX15/CtaA family protein [Burkholderiaceae bacterium]